MSSTKKCTRSDNSHSENVHPENTKAMQSHPVPTGGSFMIRSHQPEDVFTPEDFSLEHRMIQRTAQDFAEKEVLPQVEAIDSPDYGRVVNLMKQAGELGLLAIGVPEEDGWPKRMNRGESCG